MKTDNDTNIIMVLTESIGERSFLARSGSLKQPALLSVKMGAAENVNGHKVTTPQLAAAAQLPGRCWSAYTLPPIAMTFMQIVVVSESSTSRHRELLYENEQ